MTAGIDARVVGEHSSSPTCPLCPASPTWPGSFVPLAALQDCSSSADSNGLYLRRCILKKTQWNVSQTMRVLQAAEAGDAPASEAAEPAKRERDPEYLEKKMKAVE